MDEVLTRIWTDLVGRLSGPLTLRLVLAALMIVLGALGLVAVIFRQ